MTTDGVRLGDLLTGAGLLQASDLREAMLISKQQGLPVGRVLIMSGYLTEQHLQAAVQAQSLLKDGLIEFEMVIKALTLVGADDITLEEAFKRLKWNKQSDAITNKLGELLLAAEIVPIDSLNAALLQCQSIGLPLGRVLVASGAITEQMLAAALNAQVFVRDKKLTREQAIQGLRSAKERQIPIEQYLAETGALQLPITETVRLGELFLLAGIVDEPALMGAVEVGLVNEQPVGQVLLQSKAIDEDVLNAALELQNLVASNTLKKDEAARHLATVKAKGINVAEAIVHAKEEKKERDKQQQELREKQQQQEQEQQPEQPQPRKPPSRKAAQPTQIEEPPMPSIEPLPLYQFLQMSGIITAKQIEQAIRVGSKDTDVMAKMLSLSGVMEQFLVDAAKTCNDLITTGVLNHEQGMIVLKSCERNHFSLEQAFLELSWDTTPLKASAVKQARAADEEASAQPAVTQAHTPALPTPVAPPPTPVPSAPPAVATGESVSIPDDAWGPIELATPAVPEPATAPAPAFTPVQPEPQITATGFSHPEAGQPFSGPHPQPAPANAPPSPPLPSSLPFPPGAPAPSFSPPTLSNPQELAPNVGQLPPDFLQPSAQQAAAQPFAQPVVEPAVNPAVNPMVQSSTNVPPVAPPPGYEPLPAGFRQAAQPPPSFVEPTAQLPQLPQAEAGAAPFGRPEDAWQSPSPDEWMPAAMPPPAAPQATPAPVQDAWQKGGQPQQQDPWSQVGQQQDEWQAAASAQGQPGASAAPPDQSAQPQPNWQGAAPAAQAADWQAAAQPLPQQPDWQAAQPQQADWQAAQPTQQVDWQGAQPPQQPDWQAAQPTQTPQQPDWQAAQPQQPQPADWQAVQPQPQPQPNWQGATPPQNPSAAQMFQEAAQALQDQTSTAPLDEVQPAQAPATEHAQGPLDIFADEDSDPQDKPKKRLSDLMPKFGQKS